MKPFTSVHFYDIVQHIDMTQAACTRTERIAHVQRSRRALAVSVHDLPECLPFLLRDQAQKVMLCQTVNFLFAAAVKKIDDVLIDIY